MPTVIQTKPRFHYLSRLSVVLLAIQNS